eukprot:g2015.t1
MDIRTERQKQLENSPKHGRKAADLATSPSGSGAPSSLVRELTGEPRSSPEAHAATAVQQMRQVLASQLKQTLRRAGSRSHGSHGRGALKCGADVYQ